jgi:hypothetical protein
MKKFNYILIIIFSLCGQAFAENNKANFIKESCLTVKNSKSNMSNLIFQKYDNNEELSLVNFITDEGLILPDYLADKLKKESVSNTEVAFAKENNVKFEVVNIKLLKGLYGQLLTHYDITNKETPCAKNVYSCFHSSFTSQLQALDCNNISSNELMAQNIKSNIGLAANENVYAYDFYKTIALVEKSEGNTVSLTLFSKNENSPLESVWMVIINSSSSTSLDTIIEALSRDNIVEGSLFK